MKKKLINTDKWPTILLVGVGLILWQLLVSFEFVEAYVLPAPSQIINQLLNEREVLWQHLLVTLQEAGIGFLLAIVLAFVLNLLMELLPVVKKALYPILIMSQTIPIIVLAPLFGLWFGFGIFPKIIIVILVCFFPIVVSLSDATASVDEDLIHLVESMGASALQTYRYIKVPYALQGMFSGLKIAATYAIMGAVIGEWLGGSRGIGVYMLRVRHSFQLDKMFAAIVLIVILSMGLFKGIDLLQKFIMPWTNLKEEINEEIRE